MRPAILHHVSLFFAWFQPMVAYLEPPTNVTFSCHNLHHLLKWSYNQSVPGLRFRVDVRSMQSPPKEMWVDPPNLHADFSHITDPEDESMVSVTAVVGHTESDAAPSGGITFSYYKETLLQQKCCLDFPAVAVHVNLDGEILFNFKHPWLLYCSNSTELKSRKRKSNEEKMATRIPEFSYSVKVNQHLDEKFTCDTSVCEEKLPVEPGQGRQCLIVEGEMRMMFVRGSQEFCTILVKQMAHEKKKDIFIVVSALVVLIAAVFVIYMVYKKKTRPPSFSPSSMIFTGQGTLTLSREPFSVPEVSPEQLLPVWTEESEEPFSSSTEPDLRFRLGTSGEDEVAGAGNVGGPEYMQGSHLEESGISESGYEQRPQVKVELAPGDQAEGYRH